MYFESLRQNKYREFAETLYNSSFPSDERREFDLSMQLLWKEKFDFFVIICSEKEIKPVGIISLWEFESFVFIEHFAIDKALRQKGYGTVALRQILNKYSLPAIIEVEPPTTSEALKRIKFYNRLNFSLLDCNYIQPPYSLTQKPLEMKLMVSNEELFSPENIEKAVKLIRKIVYKVL